jgi:hypothetical protein
MVENSRGVYRGTGYENCTGEGQVSTTSSTALHIICTRLCFLSLYTEQIGPHSRHIRIYNCAVCYVYFKKITFFPPNENCRIRLWHSEERMIVFLFKINDNREFISHLNFIFCRVDNLTAICEPIV